MINEEIFKYIEEAPENSPIGKLDCVYQDGHMIGWTCQSVIDLSNELPFLYLVYVDSFTGARVEQFKSKFFDITNLERRAVVAPFVAFKGAIVEIQAIPIKLLAEGLMSVPDPTNSSFYIVDENNKYLNMFFMYDGNMKLNIKEISEEELEKLNQ